MIDSELKPGSLTYAECRVAGTSEREILVYTHTCHPALANDNASGIAVAAVLAEEACKSRPNLSYRFVFGPGTIGSMLALPQRGARCRTCAAGW